MNPTIADLAPDLRARARTLIEHPRFDQAIVAVIVANAITLGLETSPAITARFDDLLHAFDRTVLGVFVVELLLRLFVYRGRFFHDPWRVFDFVIVGLALLPASGAFSVLRALRVLRVLRLVSMVPSMRGVVLSGSVPTSTTSLSRIIARSNVDVPQCWASSHSAMQR